MYFNKTNIKSNNNKSNNNEADYPLFILVSLLIIISITFSYSLTIYTVEFFGYDQFHFFIRQGLVGILAIFIMWYFSLLDPDKIVKKIGMNLFVIFFLKPLTFNKTNIQYFYFNNFVKILIFFVELKISSEGATENKKNGPSSVFINLI